MKISPLAPISNNQGKNNAAKYKNCHVGFKKLLGNPAFDYLKTIIEVNSKKKTLRVKREKYIREDTHKKVWGGGG